MIDYILKTIIVGDSGVGKTTLLYKYLYGKYIDNSSSTIGINYISKNITISNEIKIKIQVWDTAGQERFRSIIRSYFRNASGCIVVYDVTNLNSFNSCSYWIEQIINENPKVKILLLGTKNDLFDYRTVSFKTGKDFAEKHNITFYETSAKVESDINQIFIELSNIIFDEFIKDNYIKKPGIIDMTYENQLEVQTNKQAIIKCCH